LTDFLNPPAASSVLNYFKNSVTSYATLKSSQRNVGRFTDNEYGDTKGMGYFEAMDMLARLIHSNEQAYLFSRPI
jgi:hypothetical protein